MAKNAGISARISGDPKPLKQAQEAALADTQAWVNRMVGMNQSIQKNYNSLAFSGPASQQKSPIAMMADQDAKAWARRMQDNQRNAQAFGRGAYGSGGGPGMAVLQTAQAVDDLQYGIRGVLNNIPGLIMSLGGGAGLAGVLALVAVGAATVGKKFWDWWVNAKRLKEVTAWVDELNTKLKEATKESEKEAMSGTAEGADNLADALERANEALSEQKQGLTEAAARSKELLQAQAARDMAKTGDGYGGAKAAQAIEVQLAKDLHAATINQLKAEMEVSAARAKSLDEYATKTEAAAAAARESANGIDPGADPFIKETAFNKAEAAQVDAAKARAAATKANNESLKEQKRIADELSHQQKVHATDLETIWENTGRRATEAEQRAHATRKAETDQAAALKQADEDKKNRDEQAAQNERRKALEDQQKDLERQIKEREDTNERNRGTARDIDGPDRSRRINARAKKARRGFGVDDVNRLQRGPSLRGQMDDYIGPVGNRRATAATDRQAHEMKVKQANQGGDPLLAELAKVTKQLEQINTNTAGMQKTKSEPLQRQ